jgi:hypothetical protein
VIAGALTRRGWSREWESAGRRNGRHHSAGITAYNADVRRAEGWLTLTEAADQLHMSGITLRLAIERGEIEAKHPLANGSWVINRRPLEAPKAVRFAERYPGNVETPYWIFLVKASSLFQRHSQVGIMKGTRNGRRRFVMARCNEFFPEQNELGTAFPFHRTHPTFGVTIQVRTSCR